MTDYTPKPEYKFTFGLWTVGNIGRDPFGGPTRNPKTPAELVYLLGEVGCSGRKRTSVQENVLGHTLGDTITVLNSYQERQTVISPYPKNLE
ncbi:MAG: hypothetical protein MUO58_18370 [Anaerolineales bacterium]|nr:hypothetical protein [Anaerolineales bacterium]